MLLSQGHAGLIATNYSSSFSVLAQVLSRGKREEPSQLNKEAPCKRESHGEAKQLEYM